MTLLQVLFYSFSFFAIGAGLMVIASKNTVHSVLFLVLVFFAMAGIWLLLSAEFLAIILVLVYVGAVMTLFLFVVMMLNLDTLPRKESLVRYFPLAAVVVLMAVGLMVLVLDPSRFGLLRVPAPAPFPADYSNTADLGSVIYTTYAYPFEVAGALLLAAIIAAITLSHRLPKNRKVQNIANQINRKPEDGMKLINMPSETKKPITGLRDNNL